MTDDATTAGEGLPSQIGPYKILRLLGEGGMGLVYEAEQRVKLKRRVAVKVMKPGLDTKDVLARFEVERQALAMMQHPGIAKVLDAGSTDEGRPYFVMELVDGEGLKEYADGQKLSIEDRVKLFIKVCRAVQHAHSKGVIHRDLKPSNILVTKRDDEALPKIIDFGVAKATGQRLTEKTLVTSFGQALGTPAYMSPEQAEASGLDVDPRTDVYSLGVTLYELLVGRLPIDPGEVGFAGFMTKLMLKETNPPTPSTRYDTLDGDYQEAIARFRHTDPRHLRSEIHGDLDLITMKAIDHDRERRYETASGFAMDLERYLHDEPIVARPPSVRYRASKFVRRHTAGVAAGVVITIGLLLGAVGMTQARRAENAAEVARQLRSTPLDNLDATLDPTRIAVLYLEPQGQQEEVSYLATGLTEELIDELSSISALSVVSPGGVSQFRGAPSPPDSIGRVLNVGTLVDGTVALSEGRIRIDVSFVYASTGEEFGSALVERPRTELFELQDDLVQEVAAVLRTAIGDELALIERQAGPENIEAWVLMQRAKEASDEAEALSESGDIDGEWNLIGVADSLLAVVEEDAPAWVEPTVRRGWLAYQRSRWDGATEQASAVPWIDKGMRHAQIALQLQPDNADALELRGSLQYWRWILDLEPDPTASDRLFDGAEIDLRQAIAVNENQAGAWALLAHLLANKGQPEEAKMAALRAFQADAYLRDSDVIFWRLYTMSYDLEDQPEANYWCDQLGMRLPDDTRFAECQLWRMTMHEAETDVDGAWELADALARLGPPQEIELSRRWGGMTVAAVIAREGMADSARAVIFRSQGDASVDPTRDLWYLEAFVRTLLGDNDEAIELLAEFMAVSGGDPSDLDFWWFSGLREEPRYQALLGLGTG